MKTEVIALRKDRPVTLTTYLLDLSPEIAWKKRPAVIICPGGAFMFTSDREAEPVAMYFLHKGYNAFVLRYTTANMNVAKVYPDMLIDLVNAVIQIKNNANQWNVDAEKIAIIGFSAGGTLAAMYSVHWHRKWLYSLVNTVPEILKPTAIVLGYPVTDFELMYKIAEEKENKKLGNSDVTPKELFVKAFSALTGSDGLSEELMRSLNPINYVDSNVPPTFIWHTADDEVVYVENSIKYAYELSKNNVSFELHIFEKGVHGLSLANKTTASSPEHINSDVAVWAELVSKWLDKYL